MTSGRTARMWYTKSRRISPRSHFSYVSSRLKEYESDRVQFLGYVFGDALAELWSNAYAVVLPSTLEGLSIALLEALSFGRCVLISDIPENLEVAGDCALSFRSRDVGDLRTKLQSMIDNRAMVEDYERRARRYVEAHFSWDHVVDMLEDFYLRLRNDTRRRNV